MAVIENFTYDELTIGQRATYTRTITEKEVKMFAAVSGDVNPVHLDEEFAAGTQFKTRIAHGMITGGLVSAAIAMEMPGPGSIYLGQDLRFERPVRLGDTITVELTITEKMDGKNFVKIETVARNQDGKSVASGVATIMPPATKLSIERPAEPQVTVA